MIKFLKSLFKPKKQRKLTPFEAIDQSLRDGYHSVNWQAVNWQMAY